MWVYIYTEEQEWQPWANTLAYYPLETDTNDYSWNGRNMTNSWITFSDGVWVFNGSSMATVTGSGWNINKPNMTIQARFKCNYSTTNKSYTIVSRWENSPSSNSNVCYMMALNYSSGTTYIMSWFAKWSDTSYNPWYFAHSISKNVWYLMTLVNENWNSQKLYLNGTQIASSNVITQQNINSIPLVIWNTYYRSNQTYFVGNVSNVILEDKARTAQEISDYYNLTKTNYWL
jgi:hypothetical protein